VCVVGEKLVEEGKGAGAAKEETTNKIKKYEFFSE
jgi:hypothetical protein